MSRTERQYLLRIRERISLAIMEVATIGRDGSIEKYADIIADLPRPTYTDRHRKYYKKSTPAKKAALKLYHKRYYDKNKERIKTKRITQINQGGNNA